MALCAARTWEHTVPVSSAGGSPEPPSDQQPAAGQPTSHWITRWQTLLVAVVTAVSAIAVAAISVSGKGSGGSTTSPASTAPVTPSAIEKLEAKIRNVQYSLQQDGSRVITLFGDIEGLTAPGSAEELSKIYAFADPVGGSDSRVYRSDPLAVAINGSWQAVIKILSSDKRDVDVYLGTLNRGVPAGIPGPGFTTVGKGDVTQRSETTRVNAPD